jgi:hypothetical protein
MSVEHFEFVDDELARARILENVIEREARRAKAREVVAELPEWRRLAALKDQCLITFLAASGAMKQLAQQFHDATSASDGSAPSNGIPHMHSYTLDCRTAFFSTLIGTDYEVELVPSNSRTCFARVAEMWARELEARATGNIEEGH